MPVTARLLAVGAAKAALLMCSGSHFRQLADPRGLPGLVIGGAMTLEETKPTPTSELKGLLRSRVV